VVINHVAAATDTYIGSPSLCILPDGGVTWTNPANSTSGLLKASNWKSTNHLSCDSTWLDGKLRGWLEGNVVIAPDGKIIDFLRVATSEKGGDLIRWTVDSILLKHPDPLKHGFQYADWQFDGRDIIFVSRTAYSADLPNVSYGDSIIPAHAGSCPDDIFRRGLKDFLSNNIR
jgi:hypothetical protein